MKEISNMAGFKRNHNSINGIEKAEIFRCINFAFGIPDLMANNRFRQNVYARHAAANYLNKTVDLSLQYCGTVLNKYHATIIHSVREHESLYKYDKEYRFKYQTFMQLMSGNKNKRWLCVETPFNLQIIKK